MLGKSLRYNRPISSHNITKFSAALNYAPGPAVLNLVTVLLIKILYLGTETVSKYL